MREEEPRDTTVMVSLAIVIGASVVFILLLLAVVSLAFYRYRYNTIRTVNEIYQSFTIFGESPRSVGHWAKLIIDRSLDLCRTKSPVSDTLV